MYKIYADDTLIWDSTVDIYKIAKGEVTIEINKSGSFVFSIYPEHFYYDKLVKLKTIIKVLKDNTIIFRGRVIKDVIDFWNNKVLTCEGELGFLNDSIIRPFNHNGTPRALFIKLLNEHNGQVDNWKYFNIGSITLDDVNIARSEEEYTSSLNAIGNHLVNTSIGGYIHITREPLDEIPTLNYIKDFDSKASQIIEFGKNIMDFTKTNNADSIITALIPLGATLEGSNSKVTIKNVNNGIDYIYDEEAVARYGWIFDTNTWDDISNPYQLKETGTKYLADKIKQNTTIELTAIDLHLLDKSIESFNVGDYIEVISKPHNVDEIMLCSKQTFDLLNPANDKVILGYTYATFTEINGGSVIKTVQNVKSNVSTVGNKVENVTNKVETITTQVETIDTTVKVTEETVANHTSDIEQINAQIKDIYEKIKNL